ncbi:ATP-grasp domain-containing protein [Streptomyces odontomachi]|uniref:ATP-grasp domain-containing protein n=1 Tax=Streptomyces odontomachi TaxID=2944940 RepID=UPI0021090385|nr:ATP-grasp domain-containing protein [Streptomyces sp. ODS25]
MSQHILVVGSGRDIPARVRAAAPGTRTSVICRIEYLSRLQERAEHSRILAVRAEAPDAEWVALAAAAHATDPFTGIATFGERDQDRCAVIGRELGLDTHTPETVALVHDKEAMRARLRAAGVDPTPSATVTGPDDLLAFIRAHGLPCVVKPTHGSASVGVAVVHAEAQAQAAVERATGEYYGLSGAGALVESFHAGPQFSVEAFSEAGEHLVIAITRKYSDPVRMVELGHVVPAELADAEAQAVHRCVQGLLDALEVRHGATHTEIVLTAAGPRVIETHLRMGGDDIPALVHTVTGVDLAECMARQCVGESVLPGIRKSLAQARPDHAAAIWFADPPATGVLTRVDGVPEAQSAKGVDEVRLLAEPGMVFEGLQSSDSRPASARAQGSTADEAVQRARGALAALQIHVRATGVTTQEWV